MTAKFKNLLVMIALIGLALASSACTQTVVGSAPVDYSNNYSYDAAPEPLPLYAR